MKLLITVGGGGHFSPALAVIELLTREDKVLVVGRLHAFEGDNAYSLEYQTCQKLGIPFKAISAGRLQRTLTRYTIPSLFKFPHGIIQAFFIVSKYKPELVFSTGGYVSVPVVIASFLLGVPVVLHEQTLEAGLANKITAFFAKKICVSWETSQKHFPKTKTIVTGNPLRKSLINSFNTTLQTIAGFDLKNEEDVPLIYITGGSGGSHAINMLVEGVIEKLTKHYRVFHQTGNAQQFGDYQRLIQKKDTLLAHKARYMVTQFVDPQEVGALLQKASLVVARSGMGITTELCYFKKLALLIPLPNSQNKEQEKNAAFLVQKGLAEVLHQDGLTHEVFYEKIDYMLKNLKQDAIKDNKKTDTPHASEEIIKILRAQALSNCLHEK